MRSTRFFGLRSGWEHDLAKRHYFRWGFDLRRYDTSYDYELGAVIEDPINDPRFYPGTRITSFHDTYEGDRITLYATDRIRVSDRFTAEIGPFYKEFWEDYLRLDLRASWTSRVGRRGEISFFIDVQNLTDRENQRGIAIADPDYTYDQAAGYSVSFPRENWLPMIPSFGVSYEF